MPEPLLPSLVPGLADARAALAQLATHIAVEHLEDALHSLQDLYAILQNGTRLRPEEQRELERWLLQFRRELRDAGVLADQGLSYCQARAHYLQPPPAYQASGAVLNTGADRHELSIDA